MDEHLFLPGLPVGLIRAAYLAAPGNEIESGKFASRESSAALVANAFGLFLDRPNALPPLPGTTDCGWPASAVALEAIVRFPWSAGRHPCLDILVETDGGLIGIESKRYEPFRTKGVANMSDAYWRPVWGNAMRGYERVRDSLRDDGSRQFSKLDVAQLVKHAFGLRTAVHRVPRSLERRPVLLYLYCEPRGWPDGRLISLAALEEHRAEIAIFGDMVKDNEVKFVSCSYCDLLTSWSGCSNQTIRRHAMAIAAQFRNSAQIGNIKGD